MKSIHWSDEQKPVSSANWSISPQPSYLIN